MTSNQLPTDSRFNDLTGRTFDQLTILRYVGRTPSATWECRCECGAISLRKAAHLLAGRHGCVCKNITHGLSYSDEYGVWAGMIQRCHNPKDKAYPAYGGRGIIVCDQWRESFEAFLADMGPRPSAQHQIDRERNDSNYDPKNCRWVLPKVNMNNRRSSRFVEFNGERLTVAEWSERTGLPWSTIAKRIAAGWPIAEALTRPASKMNRLNTA